MEILGRGAVGGAFARLRAARDEVSELNFDALTPAERLELLDVLECDRRRQPAVEHRLIQGLLGQSTADEMGHANWPQVLAQRLRISGTEARLRLEEAAELGPRAALNGEALQPVLRHLAKRQAAGEVGAEHVRIVRKFFHDLPRRSICPPVKPVRRRWPPWSPNTPPRCCAEPLTGWPPTSTPTATSATATAPAGAG